MTTTPGRTADDPTGADGKPHRVDDQLCAEFTGVFSRERVAA